MKKTVGKNFFTLPVLFLLLCMLTSIRVPAKTERYLIIGDSYTTHRKGTTWSSKKEYLAKHWADYLGKDLRINNIIVKSGYGYGFLVKGKTFLSLLKQVKPNPKITTVVIAGGLWNDSKGVRNLTAASVQKAMKEADTYIRKNFPNASVVYANINWSTIASERTRIKKFTPIYRKCVSAVGWKYLFGAEYALRFPTSDLKKYFFNDGVHPNSLGQRAIERRLLLMLR